MATAPWRNRIIGSGEESPDQLVANPKNWRTHPGAQRDALRGSLATVGWVQQVLVNKRTGHVVDGHARVEEALSRHEESVPVLYVDLDPEEESQVLATLDPIAAMAAQDDDKLRALLAELDIDDAGLAAMLDALSPVEPKAGLTDPDDVPDLGEETHIKRGDLFALGDHRLMCGDSGVDADVARLLGNAKLALIATDPPYGVDYSGVVAGRKNQKKGGWAPIAKDGLNTEGAEATATALRLAAPHAAEGCAVLVWHPTGENAGAFRSALTEAGVHILKQIIWVKPTLVFGRHEYHWRHETAMYGWFEGNRARFLGDRSETTVWEVDYSETSKVRNGPAMATGGLGEHPTQKPVELTARPIRNHTRHGDATYEPFNGSGSALIAAEQLGRRCYAMEIDPRYVAVAIKRWEDFTGRQAEQVDG